MDPAQLEALAAAVASAGGGDPSQQVPLDPSALAAIQAAILQAADPVGVALLAVHLNACTRITDDRAACAATWSVQLTLLSQL
jgi:hypothetical protein